MTGLDSVDARILLALDDDPDATILALSRRLGLARNTVHARLSKLAARDLLGKPSRRIDPAVLGYTLLAFVTLSITQDAPVVTTQALERIPEVLEVHAITGQGDLLARVVARDAADLYRLTTKILEIEGVDHASTTLAMVEIIPSRMGPLLERHATDPAAG
ncbi:MAG TPA: Lrp/AsnC family transcriptional regulator [Lacisediminihabitans sp.]|uniref:Lrp/AsnC family transcriptional regulator n=1 Tax=Lacisediminihabitans sp. TaxID=2787631 RepID=UPI002ED8B018